MDFPRDPVLNSQRINILKAGIEFLEKLNNTKAFRDKNIKLIKINIPECVDSWDRVIRFMSSTNFHQTGTCKMGPKSDPQAVVDPTLKVHEIKGLRVADASIMPHLISGNTYVPSMMIAEKAADMIKREWIGTRPTIEVQAVIRGTASLPCNIRPPMKNDSAILVVWYRNEMDAVYSFDSRKGVPNHWKNQTVVGNRTDFRLDPEPARLIIENVTLSDGGVYRCRVDFQNSPTKNHKIALQVIVPPEKPIIYDERGKVVTTHAGPFEENSDVKFICRVRGGSPTPTIRWYKKEALLNSTTTYPDHHHYVQSELVVHRISRNDLNAKYTCHAINNNISEPQETYVIVDLYLVPLNVTILSSKQPLSADRKYEIVCQTTGSHPPANITWWRDGYRLSNYLETISLRGNGENMTNSTLALTPAVEDHNKTIICRATNERISKTVIEDSWVLDIMFLPIVTLQLGTPSWRLSDIKEGDGVVFQCNVYSNPRAYKIVWKRNGLIVQDDSNAGVKTSWTKLELESVKRMQSGNYTCIASNVEGDTESNALELKVMYRPVCKASQKTIYGLAKHENASISCEVDAYPLADFFTWSFNHSEDAGVETRRKSERKRNASMLNFSPVSDTDYGHVMCSATNKAGEQTEPCVFRILPAGRPEAPHNCTIVNQTSSSLGVECLAGFNGGQTPLFILTVYEDSRTLIANLTSPTPSFLIDSLTPGMPLTMNLYAENGRGLSPAVIVEGSTLNSAEKRTGAPSVMNFSPYIVLLVGMTVFCSISAIIILGAVRAHALFGTGGRQCCFRANRTSSSTTIKQSLSAVQQSLKFDIIEDEDKNPDVVPNKKEDNYEILQLSRDDTNVSPEYYYANKKSTKSPSTSSSPTPPSPPSPLLVDKNAASSWQLTKTLHRNGDVRKKRKNAPVFPDSAIDSVDSTRQTAVKANNRTLHDRERCSESSTHMRLENAAPCNVIRMSSPKEIVTVRTPLMRSQESCV